MYFLWKIIDWKSIKTCFFSRNNPPNPIHSERNLLQTGVSCIAGRFFTNSVIRGTFLKYMTSEFLPSIVQNQIKYCPWRTKYVTKGFILYTHIVHSNFLCTFKYFFRMFYRVFGLVPGKCFKFVTVLHTLASAMLKPVSLTWVDQGWPQQKHTHR